MEEVNSNNSNTDKKNIQNKGIHRATLSLPNADAQQLPSPIHLPPASSPPQHPAWWHMVSNTPFVWPIWISPWLCPLLASWEN